MVALEGLLRQRKRPGGTRMSRMCRSKKKELQLVGWCSETEAMMGMWALA